MNDADNLSVTRRFQSKEQLETTSINYILKGEMPPEDEIEIPIKLAHCPRCDGLYFFNIHTGERFNGRCKAYKCEFCGPKKAYRLETALIQYFSQYIHIRLFTFNFRTTVLDKMPDANRASSEIWRRFITNVRRSSSLSPAQRNFDYVRILEFTKRGYPHFHCFFSEYMPIQVIQGIWHNAINQVCNSKGSNGAVSIGHSSPDAPYKGNPFFTPERAAKYCAKYVLKSAKEKPENMRLWSKSEGTKLFPDKAFSCGWFFLNLRSSFLNLYELGITSRPSLPGEVSKLTFLEIVLSQFPELRSDHSNKNLIPSDILYQNL